MKSESHKLAEVLSSIKKLSETSLDLPILYRYLDQYKKLEKIITARGILEVITDARTLQDLVLYAVRGIVSLVKDGSDVERLLNEFCFENLGTLEGYFKRLSDTK